MERSHAHLARKDPQHTVKKKIRSALAAVPLALALGAFGAQPAQAEEPEVPAFAFDADCPELPEPAPYYALCQIMLIKGGSMKLGGMEQEITQPLKIVIYGSIDGPDDESTFEVVKLEGGPLTVPGGITGLLGYPIRAIEEWPIVKVAVQPRALGGFSMNLDTEVATLDMKIDVRNDLVGGSCSIGTEERPLKLNLALNDFAQAGMGEGGGRFGPYLVMHANAVDSTFAAPATSGCGLIGPLIDVLTGLPSASGTNHAEFDTYVALANYTIPGTSGARSADPGAMLAPLTAGE